MAARATRARARTDRHGKSILVQPVNRMRAGEPLVAGPSNPHDIWRVKGDKELAASLVNEIQHVYRPKGVAIDDTQPRKPKNGQLAGVNTRSARGKTRASSGRVPSGSPSTSSRNAERASSFSMSTAMREARKDCAAAMCVPA